MNFHKAYTADPAISNSDLTMFENDIQLYHQIKILGQERVEKSSQVQTIGTVLDELLTDHENFDSKFFIMQPHQAIGRISEVVEAYHQSLLDDKVEDFNQLEYLNNDEFKRLERIITNLEYQVNWKMDTKIASIVTKGSFYFKQISLLAKGKVTIEESVKQFCDSLISNAADNPYTKEIIHKLKTKAVITKPVLTGRYKNLQTKGELDFIDINENVITPWEIKTTESHAGFISSFESFNYDRQASYYRQLIKENYPDYYILPTKFLVFSKKKNENAEIYEADEKSLNIAAEGIRIEKTGQIIKKGWKMILEDIQWCMDNNSWIHRPSYVQNNGINHLSVKPWLLRYPAEQSEDLF